MRGEIMNVYNHNGANFGRIEQDSGGFISFQPNKDWLCGYSAFELELIAKLMRKIEVKG